MNELAVYLWENYIEYKYTTYILSSLSELIMFSCNDSPDIFFIGVGAAYQAIISLLGTRGKHLSGLLIVYACDQYSTNGAPSEQEFMNRVRGLINFIAENYLAAVSDAGQVYWLSKWYRTVSIPRSKPNSLSASSMNSYSTP